MKQSYVKIDTLTWVNPITRYLIRQETTKYSRQLKFKRGKPYQDIESVQRRYHFQWERLKNDIKDLAIQRAPQIAYTVAALALILVGKHHEVMVLAVGAITLDGTITTNNNGSSFSVTVGANSNRMMILSYATYQGGGPSSVTYNSVSLTKVVEQVGSFSEQCSIWGLVAPSTGANTLAYSGGDWHGVGVYSLYDVDQNLPTNFSTVGGDSGGTSLALTTLANNSWVIACIEAEPTITMTTSGGTEDWNLTGQSFQNGEGHHVVKATAGSQTMTTTLGYGARWNACNVEIKAFVAAPSGNTNFFSFMPN